MSAITIQPGAVQAPADLSNSPLPAVGDLWLELQDELRGFIRSRIHSDATTDDLLQTTFLRAHQAAQAGMGPREPRAWLYQITRNLIRDTYRQQSRQDNLEDALRNKQTVGADIVEPLASEQQRDAADVIARALPRFIERLAPPYRAALRLTELEGLSHAEAAQRQAVTLSCMKARVRRGREQLLAALQACCTIELDARGRPIECKERESGSSCGSSGTPESGGSGTCLGQNCGRTPPQRS